MCKNRLASIAEQYNRPADWLSPKYVKPQTKTRFQLVFDTPCSRTGRKTILGKRWPCVALFRGVPFLFGLFLLFYQWLYNWFCRQYFGPWWLRNISWGRIAGRGRLAYRNVLLKLLYMCPICPCQSKVGQSDLFRQLLFVPSGLKARVAESHDNCNRLDVRPDHAPPTYELPALLFSITIAATTDVSSKRWPSSVMPRKMLRGR